VGLRASADILLSRSDGFAVEGKEKSIELVENIALD